MQSGAQALWARTTLHVWPQAYRLVSLPKAALPAGAALAARAADAFFCLVHERDEVSLTVAAEVWAASTLRDAARQDAGPFRVITFDLDLDLAVTGYLAPAAEALAAAGIPIVPQCAFLKDHLLVPEAQLQAAVETLERMIIAARG